MKKRIFVTILSMLLICSSMPTITYATEAEEEIVAIETETEKETATAEAEIAEGVGNSCTVTENCTLEVGHESDCVVNGTAENEEETADAYSEKTTETGETSLEVTEAAAEGESNGDIDAEVVTFEAVQDMIDALPDAENITEENRSDAEAQLDAIDEAKSELYQAGGDVDSLDITRYDAVCEVLEAFSESEETRTFLLGSSSLTASGTKLSGNGGSLSAGSYYLSGNVTLKNNITIPANTTVTIDLNGKTLTGNGSGSVIMVYGTLNLKDTSTNGNGKITGGAASFGAGVYVDGGTLNMTDGAISGNTATSYGGGVYITNDGSFTMTGGTISGNSAGQGGGVYVYDGDFYMSSSGTLGSGTISGNTASKDGGGVKIGSSGGLYMSGGTISGNSASNGGGVLVLGSFGMYGGTISGNTATSVGGGVGIGVAAISIMSGGIIKSNTAGTDGGGVYSEGAMGMTVTGGTITDNSVSSGSGGGVYLYIGSLTVSGSPVITGNSDTGDSCTSNVFLVSGTYITLGSLSSGASIGVTSADNSALRIQITSTETETNYYETAAGYFSSDSSNYIVRSNSAEYLELCVNNLLDGSVAISGTPTYGETLTAALSNEVPSGVTYQWMRGAEAITGATGSTYTLTADDVGESIMVVVSHSSYVGSLTAAAVTVSQATLTPAISGTTTKTYDGTTDVTEAQGLSITLTGIVTGDEEKVSAAATGYAYDSASVGMSRTITATGITLSGDAADCYTLSDETATVTGSITAAALTANMFAVDTDDETYTGTFITKRVEGNLVEDTDYTVSYSDNVNAGTGTIVIAGTGNYTGDLTYTFTINPKSVTASISGTISKVYDGTTDVIDVSSLSIILEGVGNGDAVTASAASYAYDSASAGTGKMITASGITLGGTKADNYILSNTTATADVGTITQKSLSGDEFAVDTAAGIYIGSAITRTITSSLVEDTDYTVSYSDNINAGTAFITITGMGNYTGSLTWTFAINGAAPVVSLSGVESRTYDGTAVNDPTVSVTLAGGDTDYTQTITWYAVADDGTETALIGAPSDVGSYKVVVTIDAGSNYETASESAAFTIKVAEQSISYGEGNVTKHINDTTFTNELTQTTVYGTIRYVSNYTNVATVDGNGEVNITGAGTTSITATATGTDNYKEATATYTLTVTDHTTEIRNAKDATCTEDGYTGDTVCTICEETVATGEVISATGHTPGEAVKENEVAATCTSGGSYDSVFYCTVCGTEISRESITVSATGHTIEIRNAKNATCTEDGYTGDGVCTVCGETVKTGEVIPAVGHIWGKGVVTKEPTSTASGTRTYTCTVCGKTRTETIPATGGVIKDGLVLDEDGVFRYYQNNVFAKDYAGVVPYDGGLFFIKKGSD